MTEPNTFNLDGHFPMRIVDVDGEPWFVASDVTTILGFREANDLTRSLDTDEKGPHTVRPPGSNQVVSIISESGLYSGALRSRVLQAKAFKRWIARDVLPSILRTRTYSTAPALTDAEIVRQALQITARQIEALTAHFIELTPRAAAADHLLYASGEMSVRDAAKTLALSAAAIGATRPFALLDNLGWTPRSTSVRPIKQCAIEAGHLAALPSRTTTPRPASSSSTRPRCASRPRALHACSPTCSPQRSSHDDAQPPDPPAPRGGCGVSREDQPAEARRAAGEGSNHPEGPRWAAGHLRGDLDAFARNLPDWERN